MTGYNWSDLTEAEKLDILHNWFENIDQRLRQLDELIKDLHSPQERIETKGPKNSSIWKNA